VNSYAGQTEKEEQEVEERLLSLVQSDTHVFSVCLSIIGPKLPLSYSLLSLQASSHTIRSKDSIEIPRGRTISIVSCHSFSVALTSSVRVDPVKPAIVSMSFRNPFGCCWHSNNCFQNQLVVSTYFLLWRNTTRAVSHAM
jgi:hypothetical protein